MSEPPDAGDSARERPRPVGAGDAGDEARGAEEGDGSAPRKRPLSVRESLPDVGGASSGRPTPVRETMPAEPKAPEPVEPPTTTFERDGETWVVRVEGRNLTGLPADQGRAPLLLLTFARGDAPERPVMEVLRIGRRLDELTEAQLAGALDRARPYRGPAWERKELFAETRKGHGGR